jgi:hypothetical protein
MQGGYTAHLDLDTGTLKGLEAAAGVQAGEYTTRRSARGGFDGEFLYANVRAVSWIGVAGFSGTGS